MSIFFITMQVIILIWFGYWFVISLFGFGVAKQLPFQKPVKKFIILIPAHNEENVIASLLQNLKDLKYPKHLYDVCLIADNCNDQTADIGREHGVKVLEHFYFPGEPKGKPHALKYAFDTLDMDSYDAFVVLDADNLVTTNYLQMMNNHLCHGERLIQCYLDSKNPNDNFITLSYATSYYIMNRSWQLAKSRLGLGNAIGGTGFCVDTKLLHEVGWTANSLTEDLEFTMQCLLKNIKTTWCHHAKVYDEKPTNFKISCVQRLRWARGHWDVCFKYSIPLIKKAVLEGNIAALDGAMYLMNPGKVVVATVLSFMFYLSVFNDNPLYDPFIPMAVYIVLILFNIAYLYEMLRDAENKINVIKAYASLLFISYTYIPLFFYSLLTFTNKVWVRTEHKRAINLQEVNQNV